MSPGIWRTAVAGGTWLWLTRRPCRDPNWRGEKAKACGRTDWIGWRKLFHPEQRQPARRDKWIWLFGRTLRNFRADRKRWFWQGMRRNWRLLACRGDRLPIKYRRPWPHPGKKRLFAFSRQSSWTLFQWWASCSAVLCCSLNPNCSLRRS
jgi:hypothetical protein